jgi:hypothetical protein
MFRRFSPVNVAFDHVAPIIEVTLLDGCIGFLCKDADKCYRLTFKDIQLYNDRYNYNDIVVGKVISSVTVVSTPGDERKLYQLTFTDYSDFKIWMNGCLELEAR